MSAAALDLHAQRLARAQSVLGEAEAKVAGLAPVRTLGTPGTSELTGTADYGGRPAFPIPEPLSILLPRGGLRAGSTVGIRGSARSSLTLALAGAAMGEESWCALVGMPHVGAGALAGLGLDPARTALVPHPGPGAAHVLSTLVDGIDVLVLGADLALTDALWCSLTARARAHGTVLLQISGNTHALRQDLSLMSEHREWTGISRGYGRIRSRIITVHAQGRGIAPRAGLDIELPSVHGALRALPAQHCTTSTTRGREHGGLTLLKKAG